MSGWRLAMFRESTEPLHWYDFDEKPRDIHGEGISAFYGARSGRYLSVIVVDRNVDAMVLEELGGETGEGG